MKPTPVSATQIETIRHSLAHILAQAVLRLYPDAKIGIGPAIENGFYYDFDLPHKINFEDLPQIEAAMKKIISEELAFKQIIIPREQAFDTMLQLGQTYKTELMQQIPDTEISFYKTGEDFIDLCRGPHVQHTGELTAFKLISITDTNWLNDPNRPEMQRVQGVGFLSKQELENYLQTQEELKMRDHRKLGKELNLFCFDEAIGSGMPVWLPSGYILQKNLKELLSSVLCEEGFEFFETPPISKEKALREHRFLDFTADLYYPPLTYEKDVYRLRATDSIHYTAAYRYKKRSYKELPLKLSEFAVHYRAEQSGELSGLMQTRRFVTDSSYIFCSEEQIVPELIKSLELTLSTLRLLGLHEYKIQLHLPRADQPQQYMGDQGILEYSVKEIQAALEAIKLLVRPIEGNGKFYGPEIVVLAKDIFGKEWAFSTISLDVITPHALRLTYADNNGHELTPALIRMRILGSLERMIGYLIEEHGGAFPIWLAPVQARIISISDKFAKQTKDLWQIFLKAGVRTQMDIRDETMQAKIRDAQLEKIPYMLIVGEKEVRTNSLSVRPRSGQDLGLMKIEECIDKIRQEVNTKATN